MDQREEGPPGPDDRRQRARDAVRRCRQRKLAEMRGDPAHELHGTATGWTYGCRCDECRAARKQVNARRRSDRPKPAPRRKPPRRAAKRAERAAAATRRCRQRKLAEMRGDPAHELHGTATGWTYGCRCDECRAARKRENDGRRRAYREASADRPEGAEHPWRRKGAIGR